jgi:hypothetical protein
MTQSNGDDFQQIQLDTVALVEGNLCEVKGIVD